MDHWLIRTANNILAGPYSREQVVKLIQEGKLGLQDEVCQANQYWIFLHEHLEVLNQLGISMPRVSRGEDEEITETQTDAVESEVSAGGPHSPIELEIAPMPEMPSDYEGGTALISRGAFNDAKSSATSAPATAQLQVPSRAPQAPSATSPGPTQGSTMGHLSGNANAATTAAATASVQATQLRPAYATPAPSAVPRSAVSVSGTSVQQTPDVAIERSSIWKTLAWIMIMVVMVIVYVVLRLLHMPRH